MKNKKRVIARTAILVSLLLTPQGFSQETDSFSGVERIVRQVESLFPLTEGVVVSVQEDGKLVLDLKQGQPVKPGDRLHLIRFGEELAHPATKEKLGRMETDLGEVEMLEIRKNFSIAVMKGTPAIAKVGDGVRSHFKKLSLLVAPVQEKTVGNGPSAKLDMDRLQIHLENAFNNHPRFEVPAFDLKLWLLEAGLNANGLARPDILEKLKSAVKSDFILFPSVSPVKDRTVLEYRLVSAADGSQIREAKVLTENIPVKQQPQAPRKPDPLPKEQERQADFSPGAGQIAFVGKQSFPYEIVDFDVGDIDGDGKKEIVIIDRNRVMVHRLTADRPHENNQLKQISQVKSNRGDDHFLTVDVGDINGNGRDEIFVANKHIDKLGSFVLEADEKGVLKKIKDKIGYYFRVVHPFGAKPVLLAQKPDINNPFHDGVFTLEYKEGRYVEGSELNLPRDMGSQTILYGLVQTDVNFDKNVETIMLDNNYHLRVYSATGQMLVKSDDYYGHDPRLFDVGLKEDMSGTRQGEPVRYRGRLLFEQYGDKRFLLVPSNQRLGGSLLANLVLVNSSKLVVLSVTREGLVKVGETKSQDGYLAAFQVMDSPDKKGKIILVATVSQGGLSKESSSVIYFYNWIL